MEVTKSAGKSSDVEQSKDTIDNKTVSADAHRESGAGLRSVVLGKQPTQRQSGIHQTAETPSDSSLVRLFFGGFLLL